MPDHCPAFPAGLEEVFAKLSTGYHICIEDGDVYTSITENTVFYRELFTLLGYQLSDGEDGLYYFLPYEKKINKPSQRFTAFMAIMYDWLADLGKEPVTSLTEGHFHLEELPHLTSEQYRKIMAQLEVHQPHELLKIVKGLQRHGFLQIIDDSLIKFRKPVSRFVTIFTETAENKTPKENDGEPHV
jgi:hypothetical protein